MGGNTRAQNFLDALNKGPRSTDGPSIPTQSARCEATTAEPSRKHIGGYFDAEFVELFALLKARLRLDNSALIRAAIEAYARAEQTRRTFDRRD
ncbi:MAG: hypothetical protein YHS30scaffold392_5 [Phage 64_12]|nr:MAG: hypothetical protein YHS30scaffold392_5 [Phage 64_12]